MRVGVCGQMHGCMLWKQGQAWEQKPDSDRCVWMQFFRFGMDYKTIMYVLDNMEIRLAY